MAQFYTLEEAARVLGMSPEELKAKAQAREIRVFQDRGSWQFRVDDVDELARRRGMGSDPDLSLSDLELEAPSGSDSDQVLDLSEFQLGISAPDAPPTALRAPEGAVAAGSQFDDSDSDFELTPSSVIDALQPDSGDDFELTALDQDEELESTPKKRGPADSDVTGAEPPASPWLLVVHVRAVAEGLSVGNAAGDSWSDPASLNVTRSVFERMRRGEAHRSDAERVGSQLFELLVKKAPGFSDAYKDALGRATSTHPLRLLLRFHENADDPTRCDAADHHWETMIDCQSGRMIGVAEDVRLVRQYATLPAVPSPRVEGPLRLSVGFSSPRVSAGGEPLPTLAQVNELQAFADLKVQLEDSGITLDTSFRLGLDNVGHAVGRALVFHYSGHGAAGALHLQGPEGVGELLETQTLMQYLTRPAPRLVVLNCCRGSVQGEQSAAIARAFLDRQVPRVLGVTGDMRDAAALLLIKALYPLLLTESIEDAVQHARCYLFAKGRTSDWFLPALWSNSSDPINLVPRTQRLKARRLPAAVEVSRDLDRLRPRVVVLQKIQAHPLVAGLSDAQHQALASELAQRLEGVDSEEIEREASELVEDRNEIQNVINELPPSGEIVEPVNRVVTAIELDLIPRLRELTGVLPELLRVVVQNLTPRSTADVAARQWPSPDALFEEDQAIATHGYSDNESSWGELIARAKGLLVLPDELVEQCLLNLLAGHHLLLIGPPGTGKSTIAENLTRALGYLPEVVTANPDWTTLDVVGGLFPHAVRDPHGKVHLSYDIRPGHITQALLRNWKKRPGPGGRWRRAGLTQADGTWYRGVWLIIDELNRAPMDQAFGDLFTALVSRRLRVPQVGSGANTSTSVQIPADFRLIGTANTADKHLLFSLSEALKRRFAIIEIPPYSHATVASKLVDQIVSRPIFRGLRVATSALEMAANMVLSVFDRVRIVHPIGTARAIDILNYAAVEAEVKGRPGIMPDHLAVPIADQLVPLLEGVDSWALEVIADLLDGVVIDSCKRHMARAVESAERVPPELRRAWSGLGRSVSSSQAVSDDARDWGKRLVESMRGEYPDLDRLVQEAPESEVFTKLDVARVLTERLRGLADERG